MLFGKLQCTLTLYNKITQELLQIRNIVQINKDCANSNDYKTQEIVQIVQEASRGRGSDN